MKTMKKFAGWFIDSETSTIRGLSPGCALKNHRRTLVDNQLRHAQGFFGLVLSGAILVGCAFAFIRELLKLILHVDLSKIVYLHPDKRALSQ